MNPTAPSVPSAAITEVRYSLPVMLEELKTERAIGPYAQEKYSQAEIGKLFQNRRPRHVPRKK